MLAFFILCPSLTYTLFPSLSPHPSSYVAVVCLLAAATRVPLQPPLPLLLDSILFVLVCMLGVCVWCVRPTKDKKNRKYRAGDRPQRSGSLCQQNQEQRAKTEKEKKIYMLFHSTIVSLIYFSANVIFIFRTWQVNILSWSNATRLNARFHREQQQTTSKAEKDEWHWARQQAGEWRRQRPQR